MNRPPAPTPPTLRHRALAVLLEPDPTRKAQAARGLPGGDDVDCGQAQSIEAPAAALPGRPPRPRLVPPSQLHTRSIASAEGRAALIHALAHIEFNAIDLACDIAWRWGGMPPEFYRQWAQVAREEALHFQLLREHLRGMGHDYGSHPAHNGLWEMAEKTRADLLARLALVPRTLEARGLDASPAIRDKLARAGDAEGARILELILRDEIGHVRIGNRWFGALCAQRGLDPVETYAQLARRYGAPRLRGPFNIAARRDAGFSEAELQALSANAGPGAGA